jgi:ElaA protein
LSAPAEPDGSARWPGLEWRWCRFEALELRQLQAIHGARQQVFVVEQACAFLDADAWDEGSFHLAAWLPGNREPLAYARVIDPGLKHEEPSIGRVLTTSAARGRGLGRELVRRAIACSRDAWPGYAIRISAQSRLEAFYAAFGFMPVGAAYVEDGIEHIDMLLAPALR